MEIGCEYCTQGKYIYKKEISDEHHNVREVQYIDDDKLITERYNILFETTIIKKERLDFCPYCGMNL